MASNYHENVEHLTSTLQLSISCSYKLFLLLNFFSDLPKLDTFSKSDPIVLIYEKTQENQWNEIGRTEMIKNNHFPEFVTKINLKYHFEQNQVIKFYILDIDDSKAKIALTGKGHDSIGWVVI